MTRIASEDHTEVRFCPNGFGVDRRAVSQIDMTAGAALDRGTLMLETRMSPNGKPQVLFGYYRVFPWSRAFSIQIIPRGAVLRLFTVITVTYAMQRLDGAAQDGRTLSALYFVGCPFRLSPTVFGTPRGFNSYIGASP